MQRPMTYKELFEKAKAEKYYYEKELLAQDYQAFLSLNLFEKALALVHTLLPITDAQISPIYGGNYAIRYQHNDEFYSMILHVQNLTSYLENSDYAENVARDMVASIIAIQGQRFDVKVVARVDERLYDVLPKQEFGIAGPIRKSY